MHVSRHSHLKRARLPFRHMSFKESGKRDSNSRPQPWQGCALPTELFPHSYAIVSKSLMISNVLLNCECKGSAFNLIGKTFTGKFSPSKSIFLQRYPFRPSYKHMKHSTEKACQKNYYLILSRERTKASSLRMPIIARQFRIMLSTGNIPINLIWNTGISIVSFAGTSCSIFN